MQVDSGCLLRRCHGTLATLSDEQLAAEVERALDALTSRPRLLPSEKARPNPVEQPEGIEIRRDEQDPYFTRSQLPTLWWAVL